MTTEQHGKKPPRYGNSPFKAFRRESAGSVTIAGALCLTVLVLLMTAQVQVTSALMRQTRLHQAQASAILAVAKEGDDTDAAARKILFDAYMAQNLAPLGAANAVVASNVSATKDTNSADSTLQPSNVFTGLLGGVFDSPASDAVTAERYYNPIEAVLVLDGSSSMSKYYDVMQEIVEKVTDRLFRGEATADDVRVTLLTYQFHVNIGRKYADKLFTPESRKLYKGSGTAELLAYEARKKTLEEYHINLPNDLLQEGSNTLGEEYDMACPARKSIAGESDIPQYVANLETPPADPEDGFTLLMGDGRPIREYTGTTNTTLIRQYENLTKAISATLLTSLSTIWPYSQYNGRDVREIVAIPDSIYSANLTGRTDRTFRSWRATSGSALSSDYSELVSISYECPSMPMLVGSNSRAEVRERGEMWGPGWYTGGDEGIAWAIRALSPNWSAIWEVADDYPAPYHSTTEKRILYFGGQLTRGYPDAYNSPDAVSSMCEAMLENGVDIYILLGKENLGNSESIYRQCNPKYLQTMSSSSTFNDLPTLLQGMATRQYRVRLTS